jgi:argininosuccinate synthase
MKPTIVLAYSGGLDTSWCIGWLRDQRDAEVVTVTVDCGGFTPEEKSRLAERSRALGAEEHVLIDARERFFDEVIRYLIFGNVLRGQTYPLCVGAERTLQARLVAETAEAKGAAAVAHGCTAAGNDQIRFENTFRVVAPELEVLAPVRDQATSRVAEIHDLEARGFPFDETTSAYSINSGLWGVTIGGRETLDSAASLPESAWLRTRGAYDDPPPPETHRISFRRGIPVALDGDEQDPVSLIETLDALAGRHGIGRGLHLGDTILGIKGRVAFEAPAATVLISAHRELEKLVLTKSQLRLKEQIAQEYGDWVHEGLLLDPVCADVHAFLESSQTRVTGDVHLELRPGRLFVLGVESPHSLMAATGARYGEETGGWSPRDSAGFARLKALPLETWARAEKEQP